MREKDSYFPSLSIYLLQKTAFPFGKAAIIFHFSPAQVILSIHLRECRPKAFPECGIAPALPAAWHIRQSAHTPNLLFCTRRIALHARQAVLYLPGDTSNPSENDIPALTSQNPSQTNARRMATIPRCIGRETAHGSFVHDSFQMKLLLYFVSQSLFCSRRGNSRIGFIMAKIYMAVRLHSLMWMSKINTNCLLVILVIIS